MSAVREYTKQGQQRQPELAAARPEAARSQSQAPQLARRTCACGGTPGPDGECAACKARRLTLRRKPLSAAPTPAVTPPIVHQVLRSPGQPLDATTRAYFEPRFGHDFGRVRVHTDARAAESARAVNARAYTVGSSVVFDRGRYSPSSADGRRLLAHELTHVMQQGVGAGPAGSITIEPTTSATERQADSTAANLTPPATSGAGVEPASRAVLARAPGASAPAPTLEPLEDIAQRIARLALGPNQALVQSEMRSPRGPVLTVIRDDTTGAIYVGLNTGVPANLTATIEQRIEAHANRIAAGQITVVHTDPLAIAGGHAEVNALNRAVAAREKALGRPLTELEFRDFELHNVWLSGEGRILTTAPRCEHCSQITRGVRVTQSVSHAEERASGTIDPTQRTRSGAIGTKGPAFDEPSVVVGDEFLPAGATAGTTFAEFGKSVATDIFIAAVLAGLLDLAVSWVTYSKNVESPEQAKLRQLFEKNVVPNATRAIGAHMPAAVQMTNDHPELPVYANVTVDLDETWTSSGVAGEESAREITNARFVDLDVSFKKISSEQTVNTDNVSGLFSDVTTYYATKRVTYSVEIDFGETPAQRQYRVFLHEAAQAVNRGLSARAVAGGTHFGGDPSKYRWREEHQRERFGLPTRYEEKAREERILWVHAYIEYSAMHGPPYLYTDAVKYLRELEASPAPTTETFPTSATYQMDSPAHPAFFVAPLR